METVADSVKMRKRTRRSSYDGYSGNESSHWTRKSRRDSHFEAVSPPSSDHESPVETDDESDGVEYEVERIIQKRETEVLSLPFILPFF